MFQHWHIITAGFLISKKKKKKSQFYSISPNRQYWSIRFINFYIEHMQTTKTPTI